MEQLGCMNQDGHQLASRGRDDPRAIGSNRQQAKCNKQRRVDCEELHRHYPEISGNVHSDGQGARQRQDVSASRNSFRPTAAPHRKNHDNGEEEQEKRN